MSFVYYYSFNILLKRTKMEQNARTRVQMFVNIHEMIRKYNNNKSMRIFVIVLL